MRWNKRCRTALPKADKNTPATPARKMLLKNPPRRCSINIAPVNIPLLPSPPRYKKASRRRDVSRLPPRPAVLRAAARRARTLPQSRRPGARPAAGPPRPSPAVPGDGDGEPALSLLPGQEAAGQAGGRAGSPACTRLPAGSPALLPSAGLVFKVECQKSACRGSQLVPSRIGLWV